MKINRLILLVSFWLTCVSVFAQENSDSLSIYFEDDEISLTRQVVKVDLAFLVQGDLTISYERKITDVFSVEISGGTILPYYDNYMHLWDVDEDIYRKEDIGARYGYSYSGFLKVNSFGEGIEKYFIGFKYRKRRYFGNTKSQNSNEYLLSAGYQFNWHTRWIWGFGWEYGLKNTSNFDSHDKLLEGDLTRQVLNTNISVGIIF
ncbi:MAG: hypothetical protein N4A45_07670 [Flavobacteriales bacterium]|nr:hypothetical protein [Flavobacteriales bacterium]